VQVLRLIRKLIFGTAIFVILFVALVAVLAYFYPQELLCVDSGDVSADVLVVLGGGSHERPARAVELFKQHAAPRIILSGEGDNSYNRHLLLTNGVPVDEIQIEDKSETTQENALFTIHLLRSAKVHSAIIVTSWYHSRRALKTFEHYAPDITFYSRPTYFGLSRGDWKRSLIKRHMHLEFLKIPGYWIRYGINPF
jgi:uncharacterized SAM-binding protein YcdF (DUF218 family)